MSDEQKAPPEDQPVEPAATSETQNTSTSRPKRKRKPSAASRTRSAAEISTPAVAEPENAPLEPATTEIESIAPTGAQGDDGSVAGDATPAVPVASADGSLPQSALSDEELAQTEFASESRVTSEIKESDQTPAPAPALESPESSAKPAVGRKFRSQGAYWTAGAIAAGMLIGILWFRFQAPPDATEVASAGALPTPTALAQPETSPAVAVENKSLADNSTVESRTAVDADETVLPAASDSVVAAQQNPAQGPFGASRANGSMQIGPIEDWGQVMTHFMNPFSYLRIAGQVMGSVMQAWGVIPQQPTQQ